MQNLEIVSLSGRKHSGKSEVARFFEDQGYKRLSFAHAMKKLVADLLDISLEKLNETKEKGTLILFKKEDLRKIAQETEIEYSLVEKEMFRKEYKSIRQVLQTLGTEIIRRYNRDWHTNKVCKHFENGGKFVVDDCRFKTEKARLEKYGAQCVFLLRPTCWDISNHNSETELMWPDFNRTFVNSYNLDELPVILRDWWKSDVETNEQDWTGHVVKTMLGYPMNSNSDGPLHSYADVVVYPNLFCVEVYNTADQEHKCEKAFSENKLQHTKFEFENGITCRTVSNPYVMENLKIYSQHLKILP